MRVIVHSTVNGIILPYLILSYLLSYPNELQDGWARCGSFSSQLYLIVNYCLFVIGMTLNLSLPICTKETWSQKVGGRIGTPVTIKNHSHCFKGTTQDLFILLEGVNMLSHIVKGTGQSPWGPHPWKSQKGWRVKGDRLV